MRIWKAARGFEGELEMGDAAGEPRRVAALTCEAVTKALALAAGSALARSPAATPPASPAVRPSQAPRGDRSGDARPEQTPPPQPPPAAAPRRFESARPASAPPFAERPSPSRHAFALFALAHARSDLAATFAPGIAVAVAWAGAAGVQTRLALLAHASGRLALADAAASFYLWAGRASACLWRPSAAAGFVALPCFGLEAGLVRSRGAEVDIEFTEHRFWAAGALLVEGGIHVARGLMLTVEAGASVPFTRHEYVFFNPTRRAARTPRLGLLLGAGVGWRFW